MSTTWKVLLANLTPSSASALRSGHRPIRLAGVVDSVIVTLVN
jgi:hypothetical protein